MDANAQLTDQQRVELAGLEYQPLGVGDQLFMLGMILGVRIILTIVGISAVLAVIVLVQ